MRHEPAAAVRYTTPPASMLASNAQALGQPACDATSRTVSAADLLSVAMGFDASAYSVEIKPAGLETEQLAAVAVVAWTQYHEVGKMLARSVRALRNRMSVGQYTQLLETMPGFMI